ncbi:MAG: hypothetical protein IH859_08725 [Chloroflexi bacterium]|nr:hypothetical protein [Chloroflexota bacterium]
MFLEPFGAGAVLLLTFLLLVSTIIALLHRKRIHTSNDFLIADHKATWYDFASGQIAYAIGVGSVIVFFPSLTYTYGPIAIPIVIFAWLISLVVFGGLLASSSELKQFLKTNFGLPNFVSENFDNGNGRQFILFFASLILALVYWGLFGFELVALKVLLGEMFPKVSILPILLVTFALVILYLNMGGYLSTMRTDGFQTLIFMVIICFFGFYVFSEQFGDAHSIPNILSLEIFSKRPNVPDGDIWFFALIWLILGFAYAVTSQDLWARSSAVAAGPGAEKLEHRNTYIGLGLTILALIPTVAILMMGLWMFAIDPNLGGAGELKTIPAKLINLMAGQAPIGLLIPALIAIAISTADTALITSTQAILSTKEKWGKTVLSCQITTGIIGVLGVATAFAFPDIISGVFALLSLPVVFLPLIIARIWKKGRKTWVAVVVLVLGTAIGLSAGLMGGDIAQASPLLLLVIPMVLYPLLHLIPVGKK